MLIKNARLLKKDGLWDILIKEGKFVEISQNISKKEEHLIDADGNLVIPPFVEPHVHLDTTLTAGQPEWNLSGTLFEGIQRWSQRKKSLTEEDVTQRATKVLSWQAANGIQFVRTHIDITDPNLTALKAMVKIKQAVKDIIDLQIVAFPQEGILSYPNGFELICKAIEQGADVIGAIPHFEFTREYGVKSVEMVCKYAKEHNLLVDVHCDEIDDEQSRFVEVLAAEALKHNIGSKVTASHTTAMHSYNNAYAYKLFRLLGLSGISFVANPLVNIHLQGRFDTYPKRRGITRVKEMAQAGINVCFGHDDIFDPWYPLGNGNMLQVLHMGLHVCQMMGYTDICNSLDLITTSSAKALNILDYGIVEGNSANLLILSEKSAFDAVRLQASVLYSIRGGKVICRTEPKAVTLFTADGEKNIDFKR